MKFEKGKSYETRGGCEAMYLREDEDGDLIFYHYNASITLSHKKDGRHLSSDPFFDIIGEWVEPRKLECYIDLIERNGNLCIDVDIPKEHRLARKRVVIKEGEFDE